MLRRGIAGNARFTFIARQGSWTGRRRICSTSWLLLEAAENCETKAASVTPMVAQYLARKKEYPDCLLLFQVGDFYEFFGDDARRAAHLLNLTLTKKTTKTQVQALHEMCGFPINSLDTFVEKLVTHHGVKVAICNQTESASHAKTRGSSALVDRQVVRIITPGSLLDDSMLTPTENNYLAALYYSPSHWGLAWADVSTGEFISTTSTRDKLASAILRCRPKEILLPNDFNPLNHDHASSCIPKDAIEFVQTILPSTCVRTYRHESCFTNLPPSCPQTPVFRTLQASEQAAAIAILDYVSFTNRSTSVLIRYPLHLESSDHMLLDASAWKSLELVKHANGSKKATLLHTIDATVTPGGARLLATHLASPILNLKLLTQRLDAVSYLYTQETLLVQIRKELLQICDMERTLQRLRRNVGTPKDLKTIATTITHATWLRDLVYTHERLRSSRIPTFPVKEPHHLPHLLDSCCHHLVAQDSIRAKLANTVSTIHAALHDEYTRLSSKTGFIKPGYSALLDKWQALVDPNHTRLAIRAFELKYQELYHSSRLRVRYHADQGFFIELSHAEHVQMLASSNCRMQDLTLLQSRKHTVRYQSEELRHFHHARLEAASEVKRIETDIVTALTAQLVSVHDTLQSMAAALAALDVFASHAHTALSNHFTRPCLDASRELHIEDGRHAVVEAAHARGAVRMRAFVPNSVHLGGESGTCWLLTGPNMGGKSTFLRQNAQCVVLAQMGSFVPATFARIGVVDKLFCRVGSADDLAADKSTFFMEMQETAMILTHATTRSLVVLDEVGRGTAVSDGLAIAGAVVETLCATPTRTLFATHYTALRAVIGETCDEALRCYRMEVLRQSGSEERLVFSHRVVQGLATQSYGIHTAALAGCPAAVVARARELLEQLQREDPARRQLRRALAHLDAWTLRGEWNHEEGKERQEFVRALRLVLSESQD